MAALEDREYQMDRLEFVRNQLKLLMADIKIKIKAISEDVASKVTMKKNDWMSCFSNAILIIAYIIDFYILFGCDILKLNMTFTLMPPT